MRIKESHKYYFYFDDYYVSGEVKEILDDGLVLLSFPKIYEYDKSNNIQQLLKSQSTISVFLNVSRANFYSNVDSVINAYKPVL